MAKKKENYQIYVEEVNKKIAELRKQLGIDV